MDHHINGLCLEGGSQESAYEQVFQAWLSQSSFSPPEDSRSEDETSNVSAQTDKNNNADSDIDASSVSQQECPEMLSKSSCQTPSKNQNRLKRRWVINSKIFKSSSVCAYKAVVRKYSHRRRLHHLRPKSMTFVSLRYGAKGKRRTRTITEDGCDKKCIKTSLKFQNKSVVESDQCPVIESQTHEHFKVLSNIESSCTFQALTSLSKMSNRYLQLSHVKSKKERDVACKRILKKYSRLTCIKANSSSKLSSTPRKMNHVLPVTSQNTVIEQVFDKKAFETDEDDASGRSNGYHSMEECSSEKTSVSPGCSPKCKGNSQCEKMCKQVPGVDCDNSIFACRNGCEVVDRTSGNLQDCDAGSWQSYPSSVESKSLSASSPYSLPSPTPLFIDKSRTSDLTQSYLEKSRVFDSSLQYVEKSRVYDSTQSHVEKSKLSDSASLCIEVDIKKEECHSRPLVLKIKCERSPNHKRSPPKYTCESPEVSKPSGKEDGQLIRPSVKEVDLTSLHSCEVNLSVFNKVDVSRRKRQKAGQSSACPCCVGTRSPLKRKRHSHVRHMPVEQKRFVRSALQLSTLQTKLHSLFVYLFPKLQPVLCEISPESKKFLKMVDEAIVTLQRSAEDEEQRDIEDLSALLQEMSLKGDNSPEPVFEPKIVLCRSPNCCLADFKEKLFQLLQLLLPELTMSLENNCLKTVKDLERFLDKVISYNRSKC